MWCICSDFIFSMGRHKAPKVRKAQRRNDKVVDKDKIRMITDYNFGKSISEIAAKTKRHYDTVKSIIQRYEKDDSINRKAGSGRARSTTKQTDRAIGMLVKRNRRVTVNEIRKQFGLTISDRTIIERIHEQTGFESYKTIRKPWLRPANIKKRLAWAKEHVHWTKEQWRNVIWSDESPFTLRCNRLGKCWRLASERDEHFATTPTIKHDKKINVWGCFCYYGVGSLAQITGIMDGPMYCDILENNLQASIDMYFEEGQNVLFQQDNDPKHTSKVAKEYMASENWPVMIWPAQSPW
jgi:transposase